MSLFNANNLHHISCNGAGKTTAAETILPEFLDCKEFVNADSIAKGLSPFQPETVSIQAARIMILRIRELIREKSTFAFETTLTTKSYISILKKAKDIGYNIVLYYFWIDSVELALKRISDRVKKGGHDVPEEAVNRRYFRSLDNLTNLFIPISDYWFILDNTKQVTNKIAEGNNHLIKEITNKLIWNMIYDYKKA